MCCHRAQKRKTHKRPNTGGQRKKLIRHQSASPPVKPAKHLFIVVNKKAQHYRVDLLCCAFVYSEKQVALSGMQPYHTLYRPAKADYYRACAKYALPVCENPLSSFRHKVASRAPSVSASPASERPSRANFLRPRRQGTSLSTARHPGGQPDPQRGRKAHGKPHSRRRRPAGGMSASARTLLRGNGGAQVPRPGKIRRHTGGAGSGSARTMRPSRDSVAAKSSRPCMQSRLLFAALLGVPGRKPRQVQITGISTSTSCPHSTDRIIPSMIA